MDVTQPELGPYLKNVFGDYYLHPVNQGAFNQLGSKEVYKHHYNDFFSQEDSLFVVVGSDSGLLIKYLLEKGLPSGSRALFVELPEVYERLPEVFDFSQLSSDIVLCTPDNWTSHLESLGLSIYVYLDKLFLTESVGAVDAHLLEYKELYSQMQQQLEADNWRIKSVLSSDDFIVRQIENLCENRRPAICLKGQFQGKTAIVLGGAPSLDEIVPWVQEHRDEMVVIAVSRISRRLLEVGLEPDIVVTVDPQDVSYKVSKELLLFGSNVVLVQAYHANSRLVQQWPYRQLYLGDRFPWKSQLNVENIPMDGPTVSNSAIRLAIDMGVEQILLAGIDLCFSVDGFSHAKGSYERQTGPAINLKYPLTKNNFGETVKTTNAFLAAAEQLQTHGELAAEQGIKIINLAVTSIQLPNVDCIPPTDITLSGGNEEVSKKIEKLVPVETYEELTDNWTLLKKEISRTRVRLKKMAGLAQEALKCNQGLFGRSGMTQDFKYKKRMDKIEKTLNKDFAELAPLVKTFGLRWFVKTFRPDEEKEWSDQEIEQTGKTYYETYKKSCHSLLELLEEAEKRVDNRLEELSASCDWSLLVDYWKEEQISGRALRFPQENNMALQQAIQWFHNDLDDAENPIPKFNNPGLVKGEALAAFQRRDQDSLEKIYTALKFYEEEPHAQSLLLLIDGYLHELQEDFSTAFNLYEQLLESDDQSLKEIVLQRIASRSLELNDRENAVLALECLAGLSPVYLPRYAQILQILGRFEDAATAYGEYLTKVPDDLQAMLLLGQLYEKMNVPEAARSAYQFVLEAEPEHSAATSLLSQLEEKYAE